MTAETTVKQHTPGPWTASKGDGAAHWNIAGDGQQLANVHDFIGSPTLYDRDGQGAANARLIAAAPALLAAAQDARVRVATYEQDARDRGEVWMQLARAVSTLDAAIEAATGRRP